MSEYTSSNICAFMWRECMMWAFDQPNIVAQFEHESGLKYIEPSKGGISAMIDRAAGLEAANAIFMDRFTQWATETIWGLDEAPDSYREAIAKRNADKK